MHDEMLTYGLNSDLLSTEYNENDVIERLTNYTQPI